MVVEDEVLVRMMISDRLRNAGYSVVEAANAPEALAALALGSDVMVIVSDVEMPGTMDGRALARLVRARYPSIKIVLTSGYHERMDADACDGFFPKPCDTAQLLRHIQTLLD